MACRIRFLCFLLLVGQVMHAQRSVSGVIMDEQGEVIAGANVLLKHQEDILDFALTQAKGTFQVETEQKVDSLYLEVRHLSYRVAQVWLAPEQADYTITLVAEEYDLSEVTIERPPPVRRNGDTLFFDVGSYVQESDETIEQVLSRLPGIDVLDNGKITYRGLDISKFYIEGLDLLEGRYQLATRNLRPEQIQEIQVLERHQAVRALDSIYRPDNAAINLKLKSDLALTGHVRTEGGIPEQGLVEGNVFGFQKQQQFQVSGAFHNTGERFSDNLTDLYAESFTFREDLVQLDQVRDPSGIRNSRHYLNNTERHGGLNYLRKVGENTQLKIQGAANWTDVRREGSVARQFFANGIEARFDEVLESNSRALAGEGGISLQHNGSTLYTRLDTEISIGRDDGDANHLVNQLTTGEQLANDVLEVNSLVDFIINHKNKKALQIKAEGLYREEDYRLDLRDAVLSTPTGTTPSFFPQLRQIAKRSELSGRLYTNLYVKEKDLQGLIEIGPRVSRNTLRSRTLNAFEEDDATLINPAFQNEHTTTRLSLAVDQKWTYERGRWEIDVDIPASYDYFFIRNAASPDRELSGLFLYRPALSASYALTGSTDLSMGVQYFRDYMTYGDLFYEGFLVHANRDVRTQTTEPNGYRGQRFSIGLSGLNPQNNNYYSFSIAYQAQTNEQVANTQFTDEGISMGFRRQDNQVNRWTVRAVHKFTLFRTLDLRWQASYTLRDQDQLVNQMFNTVKTHQLGAEMNVSLAYGRQATTLRARYDRFWLAALNGENDQLNLQIGHFWQINKRMDVRFTLNNLYFAGGRDHFWTHLLHTRLQYALPKVKGQLFLSVYNGLNEKYLIRTSQGLYSQFTARYRLNPRSLFFGFKRSF